MGVIPQVHIYATHCRQANELTTCRWFALVRHKSPWLGPRHGKGEIHLDQDAIMCSFQNKRGQHIVLLAVTADNLVESVLQSTEPGGLRLHVGGLSMLAPDVMCADSSTGS